MKKVLLYVYWKLPLLAWSMAAAVQLNDMCNSHKIVYETFFTTCCPRVYILGGAATCSEGFVNCFLRVPQAVGIL